MAWKKRLFSNIFWRNVLASFGERSGYSKEPGGFVPYFQYRIGDYNSGNYAQREQAIMIESEQAIMHQTEHPIMLQIDHPCKRR